MIIDKNYRGRRNCIGNGNQLEIGISQENSTHHGVVTPRHAVAGRESEKKIF